MKTIINDLIENRTCCHCHYISVKYVGPTNTRGARLRIKSLRFKDGKVIFIPYDYSYNYSLPMALDYLSEKIDIEKHLLSFGWDEVNDQYIIGIDIYKPIDELERD